MWIGEDGGGVEEVSKEGGDEQRWAQAGGRTAAEVLVNLWEAREEVEGGGGP